MHYVTLGSSANPMMLFVHGFPEFWYSWREQMKRFSSNYYCCALDLRGYGHSERPVGKNNYTKEQLVNDIINFIQVTRPNEKVILVGHDWGGILSWFVAGQRPELIEKLVIINAPHPQDFADEIARSWRQFFMSWYMFFFQLPILPEMIILSNDLKVFEKMFRSKAPLARSDVTFATEQDIECYKYVFCQPGAVTAALNFYRANPPYSAFGKNSRRPLPINVATLVVWGQHDAALSLPLATGCARYTPDFTVRIIEDAGHFVHLEQPDKVSDHIADFLKKKS